MSPPSTPPARESVHLADAARGTVAVVLVAALGSAAAAAPEFTVHTIDHRGGRMGQTALADVDRDGDLDWISGQSASSGGQIWWWEYRAPDDWVRHPLGKGNTDVGGAAHDVDGDGWVDFVSGSVLLINPGNPRENTFTAHEIGTIYSHDTAFADIDGDGRLDLLANSDRSGLFWYTVPADDPTKPWQAHTIATKDAHEVHGGVSPRAVADIDGDGDADVVTAKAWYENLDGAGQRWTGHRTIDLGEKHRYGVAVRTWTGDFDGDGDADIVQAEADNPDGRVAWFENDGRGAFTRHLIRDEGRGQDFHSLVVADFDLDGDLDVFSGSAPLSASRTFACYVWENTAGPGRRATSDKWVEHEVARKPCHEAVGADVDGDGDIDICSKPWSNGDEHFYLRNLAADRGNR